MSKNLRELPPEEITRLYNSGAFLIFLDVPDDTVFGMDLNAWKVQNPFKGAKMIPPGLHYIHYQSVGKYGDYGPRTGFVHHFQTGELLVFKWDRVDETIKTDQINDVEIERFRANLKAMDGSLLPYPYENLDHWRDLTSQITQTLTEKLQPQSKLICSSLDLVSDEFQGKSRSERACSSSGVTQRMKELREPCGEVQESSEKVEKPSEKVASKIELPRVRRRVKKPGMTEYDDDDLLPNLRPLPGTEIRFTKFPDKSYPDNASPSEITKCSMDATYVLECLLKSHKNQSDLIGELQFAFIAFVVGNSYDGFERWKRLLNVICSCETAITKYRTVYDLFFPCFQAQLEHVPEEMLSDIVTNTNVIYAKSRDLFGLIEISGCDGRLKEKAARFRDFLQRKFEWEFGDLVEEDDEDAPVVVMV